MEASGNPIYTVKSAEFTVDGDKYDVSSVSLEVVLNGIPTCTVAVAPRDKVASGAGGEEDINALNVLSLHDVYMSLSKKADELAEASLSVKLSMSPSIDDFTPELNLEGWVLISAGLTRITTTSGFAILCTIAHSAYRLTLRSGFFFVGSGTVSFIDKADEVENPLDAAVKCIEAVTEANEEEGGISVPYDESGVSSSSDLKSEDSVAEDIENAIGEVEKDLGTLRWDPTTYSNSESSIPCESVVSEIPSGEEAMKYVLVRYWADAMTQSAWSGLTGTICPEFGLQVVPEYDKPQLVLSPCMPWTENRVDLHESFVSSMVFPGRDPSPLYGYMIWSGEQDVADGVITTEAGSQENAYIGFANSCFVPRTSKDSIGALKMCSPPSWLFMAMQCASALGDKGGVTTGTEDFDDEMSNPPDFGSGDNDDLSAWNAVVFSYLNNLFLEEYKKGVSAELACAFVPNFGKKTLYPGMRIGVMSGGKTMFTGLLTVLRHTIDCANSTAVTNLSLSYCLNAGEDTIIGSEPKSPFYGSTGKLVS